MKRLIIIFLVMFSQSATAQYKNPYFNSLSVEEGLPEGNISASLQDKAGYMWLGTQNGLKQYDGYGMKAYPMADDNGKPIAYCSIQRIIEDVNGKLWVIIYQQGLFYLDRKKDAFSKLKTDFDETIGNINIILQDIGRVILNLITNAFYVVDEKKKSGIENYEPTVKVSTIRSPLSLGAGRGEVLIKVEDYGNGIPQKILDKISQPFFNTKPTGQGTGLGLSFSYDIVKAHGDELKVETKEKEGTIFTIYLPTT